MKRDSIVPSIFLWALLVVRPSCNILPPEAADDPGPIGGEAGRPSTMVDAPPDIRAADECLVSSAAGTGRTIASQTGAEHRLKASKKKKKKAGQPMHAAKHKSGVKIPSSETSEKVVASVRPEIEKELKKKDLEYGSPVFIRIFKESSEMELWIQREEGMFALFQTYPVCAFSGDLGPKTHQGDGQSPEGFYFVRPLDLRPSTQFYLGFFINYPNAYDRAHKRTGGAIMVHGKCVSIGCYSMSNRDIEEIYTLVDGAFRGGQNFFRIHIFPFRMSAENSQAHEASPWMEFWINLQEGYDFFEKKKVPPDVLVVGERYLFEDDS